MVIYFRQFDGTMQLVLNERCTGNPNNDQFRRVDEIERKSGIVRGESRLTLRCLVLDVRFFCKSESDV